MLLIALAGCSGSSYRTAKTLIDYSSIKPEPLSRTGNSPYTVYGVRYVPIHSAVGYREKGIASWYGKKFHGRRTSSGETYDMYAMTAAHKTLPLPTYVEVTNLKNNRKIIVKVNDRGPFIGKRIIDLSYAAAKELDLVGPGTGPVLVEAIHVGRPASAPAATWKYYVSAGVFGNRDNARQLTQRLTRFGFNTAHVRSKTVSGNRLHQVLIGPFSSESATSNAISRLSNVLSETPIIIRE